MSRLSHHTRRGVLISQDPGSDKKRETRLRRCVHCQFTWAHVPGSGKLRGFCTRCMGDLCGLPACVARGCVHWERQLEMIEAGLPEWKLNESMAPVTVSVPGDVPCR